MNEIVIKYDINESELRARMQNVGNIIVEMTRQSNQDQLILMQETTMNLNNIVNSYINRVRESFRDLSEIFKNTWNVASEESERYYDDTIKMIDELIAKRKESAGEEINIELEKIRQKMEIGKDELEDTKKRVDEEAEYKKKKAEEEIARRKEEANMLKIAGSAKDLVSESASGFTSALGSGTPNIDKVVNTGVNMISGGIDIATTLNAGEGFKKIGQATMGAIGFLVDKMKEVDEYRRSIMTMYGMEGQNVDDMLSGDFAMGFSGKDLISKLRKTSETYAGIQEFDPKNMLPLMQSMAQTRQFNGDDLLKEGTDVTLLSKATGIASQEIVNMFTELKLKLNTPTEQLADRFIQLNELSKDMQISFKQVINDMSQLTRDNMKYGFSQEQLQSIYLEFSDEIKKGTMSVSDLSQFIKGLTDQPLEKFIGAGALIAQEDATKYSGSERNIVERTQSMSEGERGLYLQALQTPEADFEQLPAFKKLFDKYNINKEELIRDKPAYQRVGMQIASNQAEKEGDIGMEQLVFNKMFPLVNNELPNSPYDMANRLRGINKLGENNVMGLGEADKISNQLINQTGKNLEATVSAPQKFDKYVESKLMEIVNTFDVTYNRAMKETGGDVMKSISMGLSGVTADVTGLGKDMANTYGINNIMDNPDNIFNGAVDKFDKTVDRLRWIVEGAVGIVNPTAAVILGGKHLYEKLTSGDDEAFGKDGMLGNMGKAIDQLSRAHR